MPRLPYAKERNLVSIVEEKGWDPGPVWIDDFFYIFAHAGKLLFLIYTLLMITHLHMKLPRTKH
jgi:hypothetical protein